MRHITSIILVLSTLLPMKAVSQEKALSLEDLIPGGKTFRKYYPQMPQGLTWYGDQLTYTKGDSILIAPNKDAAKPKILTTLTEINKNLALSEHLKSMSAVQTHADGKSLLVTTTNNLYIYNTQEKKTIAKFETKSEMKHNDISSNLLNIAYTRGNNLYVQNKDGKETPIAEEENQRILNGHSVHQNEFGISKGTFWSPESNLLAFYRMDESMVTAYPLVDMSKRVAELKERVYPMSGMKGHHVTVGVYDINTNKTIFLKTGLPKEKFLTNIAWSPDESTIYIAELNRGQDTCKVNSYDVKSGNKKATLFTEIHPKYVEPQTPITFVNGDPSAFVWQSRRDGYNHIYLYNTDGKLLKQITSGEWDVISVLGFDEKGGELFYISSEESPIEQHLYSINLKSGKKTKLSKEEGTHAGSLSTSGKYIFDWYTSQYNPGKVAITTNKSNKTSIFYEAKDPYKGVAIPEITLGTVKSKDQKTDLYYRIVKPTNFDENKKYPVVVYVYGGPHSQLVSDTWMGQARGWDVYMAEKGYIVFTLDNRGTQNRGFDFENITHRQLGVIETEDQMAGVDYLRSLPYVDKERIGVHGWSYGGFMTLNLMLRHPETFKVGVAGGPVTDWKYYEIMYGERYMDSPKENPEGYKESSMLNHIGNLEGRLLLIHGDEDPVVVMQHSSQLIKAAIKEGVHPDFFVYPGHEHNMIGRDRVHLHEHITRYFEDFLK